ncbi:MAG TPA: hypothetical protein VJ901_14055 [Thermoanaerobaculia bacterium]|nr:hypothetical protein [Thermoanaerobaculia bacterium]
MKRLAVALLIVLSAASAFALDTTKRGNRIGVLVTRDRYTDRGAEAAMAASIGKYLREELQKAGFDAFLTDVTYDELARNTTSAADYYVEVASSETSGGSPGGVGVGNRDLGVDISVVVAHVAAEVRLYDGRSLELIRRFELQQSKKAIAPTSISIGGSGIWGWFSIPITEVVQFRRAAHGIAKDAATQLAEYRQAD